MKAEKTGKMEFEIIYEDGTRRRVKEGILFEVEGQTMKFHSGTDSPNVLFATAEALMEVIEYLGLGEQFEKYLMESPVIKPHGEGMEQQPSFPDSWLQKVQKDFEEVE